MTKTFAFIASHKAGISACAGLVAITFSHSLGGFCMRVAIAAPLAWSGLISADDATRFALLYGEL